MDRRKLSSKTIVHQCSTCNWKVEEQPSTLNEWKTAINQTHDLIKTRYPDKNQQLGAMLIVDTYQRALVVEQCNDCKYPQVA